MGDGRVENHICIGLLHRGFGTGEGKNLYFTLSWELRVFLKYFTEGYGLAGTSGFAHQPLSPGL